MSAEVPDVSVGARLWYQGTAWTVLEHDGAGVLLRSGEQFTKVHGPSLVGVAEPLDDRRVVDPTEELDAVVLASLTTAQRADLQRQAAVFDQHVLDPAKSRHTSQRALPDRGEGAGGLPAHRLPARAAVRRQGPRRPGGHPSGSAPPARSLPGVGRRLLGGPERLPRRLQPDGQYIRWPSPTSRWPVSYGSIGG